MKKLIFIFFGLILVFVLMGIFQSNGKKKCEFEFDVVDFRDIDIAQECVGTIEDYKAIKFYVPQGSFVLKIFKFEGEAIKRGDLIATLKNERVESEYKEALLEYNKAKYVFESLCQSELREYYTKEKLEAEKELELKRVKLEKVLGEYEKLRIISPIDGRVVQMTNKEGEYVEGFFCVVSNLDTLLFKAYLPMREIEKLELGMPVKLVFYSGIEEIEVCGEIYALGLKAEEVKGKKLFPVKVKFKNELNYLPGTELSGKLMFFVKNMLSIPKSSVVEKGTKKYVIVKNGGELIFKEVVLGISGERFVEVLSGLNRGDSVVSGPYEELMNYFYEQK